MKNVVQEGGLIVSSVGSHLCSMVVWGWSDRESGLLHGVKSYSIACGTHIGGCNLPWHKRALARMIMKAGQFVDSGQFE